MNNTKKTVAYIIIFSLLCMVTYSSKSMHRNVQRYDVTLIELFQIYKEGRLWHTTQDTSRKNKIKLDEVIVTGVKGIREIGLSNLSVESGYRGRTGERIAVYIPHPANTITYEVEAVTLALKVPRNYQAKSDQGELIIRLYNAIDVNHQPGNQELAEAIIIIPDKYKIHGGKLEFPCAKTLPLPETGLFLVAEWKYERVGKDIATGLSRSAILGANLNLDNSYTWTSVGDMKQTWQHEGDKNSLSDALPQFKGKIFNALMGVKVKEGM